MSFIEHQADLAESVNLDLAHAIDLGELADIEDRGVSQSRDQGVRQTKLAASSVLPWPVWTATFG